MAPRIDLKHFVILFIGFLFGRHLDVFARDYALLWVNEFIEPIPDNGCRRGRNAEQESEQIQRDGHRGKDWPKNNLTNHFHHW